MQTRLDQLLGINGSDTAAATAPAAADNTAVNMTGLLGNFQLGSTDLPKGPTVRVLDALSTLVRGGRT